MTVSQVAPAGRTTQSARGLRSGSSQRAAGSVSTRSSEIDAPGARRYGKINPFTVDLRYMAACPVLDLAPPVIAEGFTLLPCPPKPKPKSMLDLEGCAQHRILESDRAINKLVRKIFRSRSSAASRERFVRGERAWLTYRRAVCKSRADVYEGGSAAGLVFVTCVVDRNLGPSRGN